MSDGATAWVELRLSVPQGDPIALESLDAACIEVAPGGFVVEASDAPRGDEPPPDPGWLRYRVYVGAGELETATLRLTAALSPWPDARLTAAPLPVGWRERWRRWFVPIEVSPRLVVTPPWRQAEVAAAGREVIVIEPGLTFGTGQHESTRLCLDALDALAEAGELAADVLDVGCGSGIVGIVAARLGAERVYGVDVDPLASPVANDNAAINGVAERARFDTTPIERLDGRWPLVIANMMTHILLAIREALAARVAPGGLLVLSGILGEHEVDLLAGFRGLGLEHVATVALGDWIRLELRRP